MIFGTLRATAASRLVPSPVSSRHIPSESSTRNSRASVELEEGVRHSQGDPTGTRAGPRTGSDGLESDPAAWGRIQHAAGTRPSPSVGSRAEQLGRLRL